MGCSESKIIPIKNSKAQTPTLVPSKRISVTSVGESDPEIEVEIGMSDENWNIEEETGPMDEDAENGMDVEFITEHSELQKVKQVEKEFIPRENIELVITGTACSRMISGAQKTRMEEAAILKSLIDEGLISKPLGKTATGLSFEIVEDEDASSLAASSRNEFSKNRLATLEEHRERFTKQMSSEKISEKLSNAESRRKRNMRQLSINETEQDTEVYGFSKKSDTDFDEPEHRPPGRRQSIADLKREKIKLDNSLQDNFAMMDIF